MTRPSPADRADATWHPASPWPGWAAWLASIPLFAGLSRRQQKRLARLATLRTYADGRTLTRAGSRGDAFFAILRGRAELHTPAGRTRDLEAGDFFGELALIDGAPRTATIVAAGDVSTACIQRPALLELLRTEPQIALGLVKGVVAIIRDLEGDALPPPVTTGVDAAAAEAADPLEELSQAGRDRTSRAHSALLAASLLAGVPLFAELPKRRLAKVARIAEVRRYQAGALVARAGARGGVFHLVVGGRAQAVTRDRRTNVIETGGYFGELALLDGAPRSATVSALDDLVTLGITRSDLMRLLREEPTIAVGLLRGLVALVRHVEGQEAG
jgi:CRP-like cAMP-binding protein